MPNWRQTTMKRSALFLLALVAPLFAACSSDRYVRATTVGEGKATLSVEEIKDGVPTPLVNPRTVTGAYTATAQTIPPYLTLEVVGPVVEAPRATRVVEKPGDVVILPAVQAAPLPKGCPPVTQTAPLAAPASPPCYHPTTQAAPVETGATGWSVCTVPAASATSPNANACATPRSAPAKANTNACAVPQAAKAAPKTCVPYVGCSGVLGGNRPTPTGEHGLGLPAGTGWPCKGAAPKAASGGCPRGLAAIIQGIVDLFVPTPAS
jgi:hypothetical protein